MAVVDDMVVMVVGETDQVTEDTSEEDEDAQIEVAMARVTETEKEIVAATDGAAVVTATTATAGTAGTVVTVVTVVGWTATTDEETEGKVVAGDARRPDERNARKGHRAGAVVVVVAMSDDSGVRIRVRADGGRGIPGMPGMPVPAPTAARPETGLMSLESVRVPSRSQKMLKASALRALAVHQLRGKPQKPMPTAPSGPPRRNGKDVGKPWKQSGRDVGISWKLR